MSQDTVRIYLSFYFVVQDKKAAIQHKRRYVVWLSQMNENGDLLAQESFQKKTQSNQTGCMEALNMEPAEMDRMMEFQVHLRQFENLAQLVGHLSAVFHHLEQGEHEAQMWLSKETGPGRCNLDQEVDQIRQQVGPLSEKVWKLLHECRQSLWNRFCTMENHT